MKIYKFFAQSSDVDKPYLMIPCEGQNIESYIKRTISLTVPKKMRGYNCFELIFDALRGRLINITELNVPYIKPEAIKFANEINEITQKELEDEKKDDPFSLSIYTIQDVIDRGLFYGSEFEMELISLLDRFPLKVELVKVDETDINLTQRKVSKF